MKPDVLIEQYELVVLQEGWAEWSSTAKNFFDTLPSISQVAIWLEDVLGWLKTASLVAGGSILIAKIFAFLLYGLAKLLDKNVKQKQEIVNFLINQSYMDEHKKLLIQINKKIENNQDLTSEELEQASELHKKIKEKIANQVNSKLKLNKKEKIAKGLHLASKFLNSKIGIVTTLFSSLFLFYKLNDIPSLEEINVPNPSQQDIEDIKWKILDYPKPQFT